MSRIWYTRCETCSEMVEACATHNGIGPTGHYVHCGWGHECSLDDLLTKEQALEATREEDLLFIAGLA